MNIFVGLLDLADGSTLVTNAFIDEEQAINETKTAYDVWIETEGRNSINGWDVTFAELIGLEG